MNGTLQQRKARFEAEGISIADWARERGYNLRTVYAVLRGELKAKRGISHRIAVELEIKPDPKHVARRA